MCIAAINQNVNAIVFINDILDSVYSTYKKLKGGI